MKLKTSEKNGIVIAHLEGRIDSSVAKEFEQNFLVLANKPKGKLIADFSQLAYISSAGLRVLLMAAKEIKNQNGAMILCSMNAGIKEVFTVSGFGKILNIQPSLEDALKAF